jgi:hypothetical protein
MLKRIVTYIFAAWVLAVVIQGLVALLANYNVQKEQKERFASGLSDQVDEIFVEAENRSPNATGLDAVDASNQVVLEKSDSFISEMPTDAGKRRIAIRSFSGFYYASTVAWPEYCRKFGVEIPIYVQAFRDVHGEELAIALANEVDIVARVNDPSYRAILNPSVQSATERNMQALAQEWGLSDSETCEAINEHGVELAEGMRLSEMAPDVYAAMRL